MRATDAARLVANHLLRICLAPSCAGCHATLEHPLDGPVCASCWAGIVELTPPLCEVCGDQLEAWRPVAAQCPRCRRGDRGFHMARALGVYDGTLKALIHACKYGRHRGVGAQLSERMRRHGAAVLAGADAVVPVPLHPWRQLQRGFNQADDLATGLGPPVWRVLRRTRLGRVQASLPVSRRHANVRGAYGDSWRHRLAGAPRVSGAVVVLVDDVMTTGATLSACARVLRRMGVREVRALTAARAVAGLRHPPPPPPHLSTARRR